MSLIQQQPNTTRKRPRSSFSEWNSILKNNFNEPEQHNGLDVKQAENVDSSVIILDSDDETYGLNNDLDGNDTDETDSIVFVREDKIQNSQDAIMDDNDNNDNEDEEDDDHVVDDDDDDDMNNDNGSFFNALKIRKLFKSNVNDSFNLNLELPTVQPTPVNIGLKKRRTNSLPQLPLSQISYRRVSESMKIGEVKPNLIVSNRKHSSSSFSEPQSHSNQSCTSTAVSSASSSNEQDEYHSSDSPLSPLNRPKEKVTDDNGYYIAEPGELFANGRFKILSILGQGTFGKVIKALDYRTHETVAIKIIRAIPKYREASKIELRILTTLKNADPQNLNNCIHLREVFDYENHICIITDLLDISLYEFLQSNKFKPFPGSQIQAITRQLIRSVAFLHDLKLIHTDLKPENILLTDSDFSKFRKNKVLKNPLINIIDFGSAIFNDEYHSELVSTRHYRAPEIVLGTGWSFPCDLWSLGCILVELVTGEALFNTHENLEHLAIMEKVLGYKLPNYLIQRIRSNSVLEYFKKNGSNNHVINFPNESTTQKSLDFVSKLKRIDELICSKLKLKIKINIDETLMKNWEKNRSKGKIINFETFQFWYYFIDLVFKLLNYDPDKRICAIDAMNHPWWDYGIIDEATSML